MVIVRKQNIIKESNFEYAVFFIGFYYDSSWLTIPALPINAEKIFMIN
jgi:hypothetical protein